MTPDAAAQAVTTQATGGAEASDRVGEHPWLALIAIGLASIGVGLFVWIGWTLRDWFNGDPSIYLVYARNFAQGDFFRFNPGGDFSSGVSSALWVMVLAVPFALGLGVAGAKVWAFAWTLVAFGVTVETARRVSGSAWAAALAGLYLVASMSFYGIVLYDAALTVALVALSVLAGRRVIAGGSVIPVAATWGLLLMARPDATIVIAAELVALLVATRRPALVGGLVLASLPAAAYYAYSIFELGTYSVSNVTRTIDQALFASTFGPFHISGPAIAYLAGLAIPLAVAALGVLDLQRSNTDRWLVIATLGAILGYVALLVFYPVTWYVERYFLPVAPLVVIAIARALISPTVSRLGRGVVLGAVSLGLAGAVLGSMANVAGQAAKDYTFDIQVETEVVSQVNEIAPQGATVLGYEVQDRFDMRPDIRYLSINGLTDGLIHPYRQAGDMIGYLERFRPAYWIVDDPPDGKVYTDGTIFQQARETLLAGASRVTLDGITFRVLDRRTSPGRPGMQGWLLLVGIDY